MSAQLGATLVVVALIAVAYLAIVYQRNTAAGYRLEVEPKTAVVVKDLWTGVTRALLAGSHTLTPGRDKVVQTVSLKDEPSDPPIMMITTSDRIEIGANVVIHEQKVMDNPADILKAGLNIKYEDRQELILTRVKAGLQKIFIELKLEEVYHDNGVDPAAAAEIEQKINQFLNEEVTTPWGIRVVVHFQDIVLPDRLKETAEESETAQKKGQAIKDRAAAAGVDATIAYLAEAAIDAIAAFKGHNRKGGDK